MLAMPLQALFVDGFGFVSKWLKNSTLVDIPLDVALLSVAVEYGNE